MFYLSEVIGKRIFDHQGRPLARIRDLVAEVSDSPMPAAEHAADEPVVFMQSEEDTTERDAPVIKGLLAHVGRKHQPFYVPIEQIKTLGADGARIRSSKVDLQPFERRAGEMLLTRDLWDKQIIDLERRKVVRVNDVALTGAKPVTNAADHERWWVRGVEVGLSGLVRRLHLTGLALAITRKPLQPRIVRWQHIDVFGSNVPGGVALQHQKLANFHPVEIARITDSVSYLQGAEIIASLDDTLAADTLEEIVADRQTDIMEQIPNARAADIIEEMSPDEATDLLSELPDDKANALLKEMDEEEAQEVRQLMRYPEDSAGGLMTTDFVRALPSMTTGEVIEANRATFQSGRAHV